MRTLQLSLVMFFMFLGINTATADVSLPDWVSYDATKKQVEFKLIAAKNANNNGFNYNGYYEGNITLKAPVGWQVQITLTNRDANATHDVILTEPFEQDDMPDSLTGEFSSIKRAYISPLFANETDNLRFTAKAGEYWLFCGVKGHGIEGMWIKFKSDKNGHIPSVEIKN